MQPRTARHAPLGQAYFYYPALFLSFNIHIIIINRTVNTITFITLALFSSALVIYPNTSVSIQQLRFVRNTYCSSPLSESSSGRIASFVERYWPQLHNTLQSSDYAPLYLLVILIVRCWPQSAIAICRPIARSRPSYNITQVHNPRRPL